MGDQSKKRVWTIGKHSGTQDFSSTPATLRQLMPLNAPVRLSPARRMLPRTAIRSDGKRPVPHVGIKDVGMTLPLEFILRGPSGSTGAAIVSATATELGDLFDTCLGAAVDPAGAADTVTGGNGATPNLTVTSGAGTANGMVVGFLVDGSAVPVIRQIVSGGGTGTLVLDRDFSGTPTNGGTLYRGPRWIVQPSVHELAHCYLRGEADNRMRQFYGCMSKVGIKLPVGDRATAMFDFSFTDVDDAAEANPTYTGPTAGNGVVTNNNRLYLGDDPIMALDIELDYGGTMVPRIANSGPHDRQGYTVQRAGDNPVPVVKFKAYAGTNSTLGEIADSTGNVRANYLQGWDKSAGEEARSFDLAVQAGNVFGGIFYARAPVGVFTKCEEIEIDGQDGYDCEVSCFDPSSGAPLDLSLL